MIDPATEKLIKITEVGRAISPSRPVHAATAWRWCLAGVGGVKLESVKIGGCRYTSAGALARFLQALNEPHAVPEPVNAAAIAAAEELKRRGV